VRARGVIYSNDFDGSVTSFATISSTDNFNSGAWGNTGNGYWVGRDSAFAVSNLWSDTDDGGYGNDWNESFYIRGVDLNNTDFAEITFNMRYDMESGFDFAYVDVSTDGGANWTNVASVSGVQAAWTPMNINLTGYVGNVIDVRFRFVSDSSVSDQDGGYDSSLNGFDGAVYLDDIVIDNQP